MNSQILIKVEGSFKAISGVTQRCSVSEQLEDLLLGKPPLTIKGRNKWLNTEQESETK